MVKRLISFLIIFSLVVEQSGFAQVAPQMPVPAYLNGLISPEKFRPMHLRSLGYDAERNAFDMLLEKGDSRGLKQDQIEETADTLMRYFQVGLRLPNSTFWVNLRPDSPRNIIDPYLEKTEVGRIMLAADLQLKKDLSRFTSPATQEGRAYWNKLYAKAEALFGNQPVSIPTVTRPWIVPAEVIIKEYQGRAYVYKATMKVMLEQDHLPAAGYQFDDPRLKQLNDYSSDLVRRLIIPRLTREVNSSRRYAELRQVFYSLVLAQWFKLRVAVKKHIPGQTTAGPLDDLIKSVDSRDLTGLMSGKAWSKEAYFKQYQSSFQKGEYDIQEAASSAQGMVIRRYFSGGETFAAIAENAAIGAGSPTGTAGVMTIITDQGNLLAREELLAAGAGVEAEFIPDPDGGKVIRLAKERPLVDKVDFVYGAMVGITFAGLMAWTGVSLLNSALLGVVFGALGVVYSALGSYNNRVDQNLSYPVTTRLGQNSALQKVFSPRVMVVLTGASVLASAVLYAIHSVYLVPAILLSLFLTSNVLRFAVHGSFESMLILSAGHRYENSFMAAGSAAVAVYSQLFITNPTWLVWSFALLSGFYALEALLGFLYRHQPEVKALNQDNELPDGGRLQKTKEDAADRQLTDSVARLYNQLYNIKLDKLNKEVALKLLATPQIQAVLETVQAGGMIVRPQSSPLTTAAEKAAAAAIVPLLVAGAAGLGNLAQDLVKDHQSIADSVGSILSSTTVHDVMSISLFAASAAPTQNLPFAADIAAENAQSLYSLPAPLIKVPEQMPVAGYGLDQEIYISFPTPELKLGKMDSSIKDARYYVIDEQGVVYPGKDGSGATGAKLSFMGEDSFAREYVYLARTQIADPGVYYLVLELPSGQLLKSGSFRVVEDPFQDAAGMLISSYGYTSTKNLKDFPRAVKIVDKNKNTIKTIDAMPHTMIPEASSIVSMWYMTMMYNVWSGFVQKDSVFSPAHKEQLQQLIMDQTPWMLAMQAQEGSYAGAVYRDEADESWSKDIQYDYTKHDRVIQDLDENNYSTAVTGQYAAAMCVAADVYAQHGDKDMAVKSSEAAVKAWLFLVKHREVGAYALHGPEDGIDMDERILAATELLKLSYDYPDIYAQAAGSEANAQPKFLADYITNNMPSLHQWIVFEGDRHDNIAATQLAFMSDGLVGKYGLQGARSTAQSHMITIGNRLLELSRQNPYHLGGLNDEHDFYAWGSSRNKLDKTRWLLVIDELAFRNDKANYDGRYLNAAYDLWSSVVEGRNIYGRSFMMGYSETSPRNPHDMLFYTGRLSLDQMKGRIVDGPSIARDDKSIPGLYDIYEDIAVGNKPWVVNEPTFQEMYSAAVFADTIDGVMEKHRPYFKAAGADEYPIVGPSSITQESEQPVGAEPTRAPGFTWIGTAVAAALAFFAFKRQTAQPAGSGQPTATEEVASAQESLDGGRDAANGEKPLTLRKKWNLTVKASKSAAVADAQVKDELNAAAREDLGLAAAGIRATREFNNTAPIMSGARIADDGYYISATRTDENRRPLVISGRAFWQMPFTDRVSAMRDLQLRDPDAVLQAIERNQRQNESGKQGQDGGRDQKIKNLEATIVALNQRKDILNRRIAEAAEKDKPEIEKDLAELEAYLKDVERDLEELRNTPPQSWDNGRIAKGEEYRIKGDSVYFERVYGTPNPVIIIDGPHQEILGRWYVAGPKTMMEHMYVYRKKTERLPEDDPQEPEVFIGTIFHKGHRSQEMVHKSELETYDPDGGKSAAAGRVQKLALKMKSFLESEFTGFIDYFCSVFPRTPRGEMTSVVKLSEHILSTFFYEVGERLETDFNVVKAEYDGIGRWKIYNGDSDVFVADFGTDGSERINVYVDTAGAVQDGGEKRMAIAGWFARSYEGVTVEQIVSLREYFRSREWWDYFADYAEKASASTSGRLRILLGASGLEENRSAARKYELTRTMLQRIKTGAGWESVAIDEKTVAAMVSEIVIAFAEKSGEQGYFDRYGARLNAIKKQADWLQKKFVGGPIQIPSGAYIDIAAALNGRQDESAFKRIKDLMKLLEDGRTAGSILGGHDAERESLKVLFFSAMACMEFGHYRMAETITDFLLKMHHLGARWTVYGPEHPEDGDSIYGFKKLAETAGRLGQWQLVGRMMYSLKGEDENPSRWGVLPAVQVLLAANRALGPDSKLESVRDLREEIMKLQFATNARDRLLCSMILEQGVIALTQEESAAVQDALAVWIRQADNDKDVRNEAARALGEVVAQRLEQGYPVDLQAVLDLFTQTVAGIEEKRQFWFVQEGVLLALRDIAVSFMKSGAADPRFLPQVVDLAAGYQKYSYDEQKREYGFTAIFLRTNWLLVTIALGMGEKDRELLRRIDSKLGGAQWHELLHDSFYHLAKHKVPGKEVYITDTAGRYWYGDRGIQKIVSYVKLGAKMLGGDAMQGKLRALETTVGEFLHYEKPYYTSGSEHEIIDLSGLKHSAAVAVHNAPAAVDGPDGGQTAGISGLREQVAVIDRIFQVTSELEILKHDYNSNIPWESFNLRRQLVLLIQEIRDDDVFLSLPELVAARGIEKDDYLIGGQPAFNKWWANFSGREALRLFADIRHPGMEISFYHLRSLKDYRAALQKRIAQQEQWGKQWQEALWTLGLARVRGEVDGVAIAQRELEAVAKKITGSREFLETVKTPLQELLPERMYISSTLKNDNGDPVVVLGRDLSPKEELTLEEYKDYSREIASMELRDAVAVLQALGQIEKPLAQGDALDGGLKDAAVDDVQPAAPEDLGGVDFRMIPVVAGQPAAVAGSGVAAEAVAGAVAQVNVRELDQQWQAIQARAQSGEMPYAEMRSYIKACGGNKDACESLKRASSWIMEVLKMEEDAAVVTAPAMKEILAIL
ncbi:MAG TPA: glycoside hydrolase family 9 protein [Candidatus Omnitrophota bacterium]|nr:glycoside hydrolase family 9 protein [Candidatus Omnitrophota bacterium]HRZ14081.1 glycoside hydrolase family 9 protein [Candidatus Omnitrophota bacterium]